MWARDTNCLVKGKKSLLSNTKRGFFHHRYVSSIPLLLQIIVGIRLLHTVLFISILNQGWNPIRINIEEIRTRIFRRMEATHISISQSLDHCWLMRIDHRCLVCLSIRTLKTPLWKIWAAFQEVRGAICTVKRFLNS